MTDDETPIELLHECPNCWALHQVPDQLCVGCEKDGVVLNMSEQRSPYPSSGPQHSATLPTAGNRDEPVQCQGCGTVRGLSWLGRSHNCWRNEDGTYEEGGTFQ